jgi:hypothetical protein
MYASVADFIGDFRAQLQVVQQNLMDEVGARWRGRTNPGTIRFSAIPVEHRLAARNLINNNLPAPGHDRGIHNTNPSAFNHPGHVKEFDLSVDEDGRMTRLIGGGGRRAYYYSRHHAAATYQYLLVTDNNGRPYFRGGPAGNPARLGLIQLVA